MVNTTGKKETEVVLQSVRGVEERMNVTTGMRAGAHGVEPQEQAIMILCTLRGHVTISALFAE